MRNCWICVYNRSVLEGNRKNIPRVGRGIKQEKG
nr:MAG TPA: hypothetical protein [Caudoviricetes sp.]